MNIQMCFFIVSFFFLSWNGALVNAPLILNVRGLILELISLITLIPNSSNNYKVIKQIQSRLFCVICVLILRLLITNLKYISILQIHGINLNLHFFRGNFF